MWDLGRFFLTITLFLSVAKPTPPVQALQPTPKPIPISSVPVPSHVNLPKYTGPKFSPLPDHIPSPGIGPIPIDPSPTPPASMMPWTSPSPEPATSPPAEPIEITVAGATSCQPGACKETLDSSPTIPPAILKSPEPIGNIHIGCWEPLPPGTFCAQ